LTPGTIHNGANQHADLVLQADVCVVGSGAGGAVVAAELQRAGHEVLLLEEGGHFTSKDFRMQEADAFPMLYQDAGLRTTTDYAISILQGRAVGGSTVVNWTTCFRTPAWVLDHWRVRHAVVNLDEAALEPHWRAVEERLNIHKTPETELNRNNRLLLDGCRALGWQAETTRRNVRACQNSGYCGMGCPVDAKQSMLVTYIPDALAGGATILSRCRVDTLAFEGRTIRALHATLLDDTGRTPTGRRVTVRAKRFVLAAGAMGTPAILLRSGVDDPAVGKRTFLHPVVVSIGVYDDPVLACYGAPQSMASHQFVHRGGKSGFVMEAAPLHPVLMATAAPGFGADHRSAMEQFANCAPHVALMVDGFFPDETGGTVTLRPLGAPVLDYAVPPRIQEAMREAQVRLAEAQFASGAKAVFTTHEPAVRLHTPRDISKLWQASFAPLHLTMLSAHVMGGCPMGEDPVRAFVRCGDLRAHRFDNLHVVDGSVFPTSLGVNPQLSIYGLAHRAAQHIHAAGV
jgi:choline dehydrogenase-like flavoprotein